MMYETRKNIRVAEASCAPKYLNEIELAARWNFSLKWVQKRRQQGDGPPYSKFGHRIRYALADIEKYEAERRIHSTSELLPPRR